MRRRLSSLLLGSWGSLVFLVLTIASCGSGSGASGSDAGLVDAGPSDAGSDDGGPGDGAARPDAVPDSGQAEVFAPDAPEPDMWVAPAPFRVGVAKALLNAPLGMGVAGYGPAPAMEHQSPFAQIYAATDRILSPLTVKAIAIESGYEKMVIVRLDVIAVVKEVRRGVAQILAARGVDIGEDELLMAATHTHSAPARILNKTLWFALADIFWPQHYDRMLAGIADVVEAAWADREPARFGFGEGCTDEAHSDRRCENPPLLDGTMPVLRFDRANGSAKAVIVIYAVHGTVIDNDDYAFSSDAGGAIEYKLAERFDTPVEVMFLNAWAGDVSPADPRGPAPQGPLPAIDGKTDRLEAIGNVVADEALSVWSAIETTDEVIVDHLSALVALNQEAMGYAMADYPYPYGGVYCGANLEGRCYDSDDPAPDREELIKSCGMFDSAEQGITSTVLSVYRLGELLLPTFPGEAVTQIGRNVVDGIRAATGWKDIAFVGYAQDYIGYSETEEYWWNGGYETSGATWGPLQGDYLTAEAIALVKHFVTPETPFDVHLAEGFSIPELPENSPLRVIWETEDSLGAGTISEEPGGEYVLGDTVHIAWTGGDPWIDRPRIWLERQGPNSGAWSPFPRQNGTTLANDAYEFQLGLRPEPSYLVTKAHTQRTFYWWAELPTARIQPTTTAPIVGTFRFRVEGAYGESGESLTYEATSRTFVVSAP